LNLSPFLAAKVVEGLARSLRRQVWLLVTIMGTSTC
jgi:hypothetical protein